MAGARLRSGEPASQIPFMSAASRCDPSLCIVSVNDLPLAMQLLFQTTGMTRVQLGMTVIEIS